MAENVDADAGDEVKFVHLADRSQGEIVDNGDGTWTFNPAPGFTGEADIAYVIDKDGVLHDEQTGVVVKEDAPQENVSPEIDSISTTEMAADGTLSFTNDDMLSTLSDAEGDSLSIESVSLMEGQGVIETDNQGNYQFTPAEATPEMFKLASLQLTVKTALRASLMSTSKVKVKPQPAKATHWLMMVH